jgi:hypothetical protein
MLLKGLKSEFTGGWISLASSVEDILMNAWGYNNGMEEWRNEWRNDWRNERSG